MPYDSHTSLAFQRLAANSAVMVPLGTPAINSELTGYNNKSDKLVLLYVLTNLKLNFLAQGVQNESKDTALTYATQSNRVLL